MSTKENLFDRRVAARNIKHGRTNRKEFEQHLAGLPDVSGKAVPIFSAGGARDEDFSGSGDDLEREEMVQVEGE